MKIKVTDPDGMISCISQLINHDDCLVIYVNWSSKGKYAEYICSSGSFEEGNKSRILHFSGSDRVNSEKLSCSLEVTPELGDDVFDVVESSRYTCFITFFKWKEDRELLYDAE